MPSSVISSMHYFPDKSILRIRFVSGLIYDYLQVPEKTYEEMKKAFSKGTYLNQKIKNRFQFRKVS